MIRTLKIALLTLVLAAGAMAQTTTTYTGTIKDLTQNPVTSGQVTFTLAPPVDSTLPGVGRFAPSTVYCNINTDGTLSANAGGACVVTMNTALSPAGTSYRICIQPQSVAPGSCFYDYALTSTKDITTIAPTLSTGPLNYGGIQGPQGASSITGMSGDGAGNATLTGKFTAGTVAAGTTNGVINAETYPGADIGAKINAAIVARGAGCGTISIAPGSYPFSTQIVKPRCIVLEGNNAVLTWTGTNPNIPAMVTGSVAGIDYTFGGIRNLKLVGNGLTPGIYMGGGIGAYAAPAGISDYLEKFESVTVSSFLDNYVKGGSTYQMTVIGGASTSGVHSNWLDLPFGSENMNFSGWQNLNAPGWGFYSADLAGATYNFSDCSFDYNAAGQLYFGDGSVRIQGGHMEGPASLFIDGPASSIAGFSTQLVMTGGNVIVYTGSNTNALFRIRGNNSNVYIDPGLWIYNPSGTIGSLVDWEATASSNQLTVGAYSNPTAKTGVALPAVQYGANIQWLDIPRYTQYVPTDHYESSAVMDSALISNASINTITRKNIIGGYNNGCASATSSVDLQYGGLYLGWNCDGLGGADFYAPFILPSGIAYHWRGKLAEGTWTDLMSLTRGGVLNVQGIAVGGQSACLANGTNCKVSTGTPTAGQAACIKSVAPVVLGYCSTVVSSTGACTCN